MAKSKSSEPNVVSNELPTPEVLKPKSEAAKPFGSNNPGTSGLKEPRRPRMVAYRPSHKATYIALAVIALILAINAGVIFFVLKSYSDQKKSAETQISLSSGSLEKLGIKNSKATDSGVVLNIGPNTKFKNNVAVGGNLSVNGAVTFNNKIAASGGSFTTLQAGNTQLSELNVNGNTTLSNLNLRNDLIVEGKSLFKGGVTVTGLVTVNNSMNVSGNFSVGGVLSVTTFRTNTLYIGGHVITTGNAPSVSVGSCNGHNGSVSISGNDAAGTVAINIGVSSCAGVLAWVNFNNAYERTPRVVISPIGGYGQFFVNRNSTGFSIWVGAPLGPGGYALDYIVEQ